MTETVHVPCNGCTLCCRNDMIFLHPEDGDDPSQYITEPVWNPLYKRAGLMLAKKEDGDCIYLGAHGCTIHDRAPVICREFDCGKMFDIFDRPTRRRLVKSGQISADVFAQGRRVSEARRQPLTPKDTRDE